MDRVINIKINGTYLKKDNRVAGVQYEGNATTLQFEFDESWKDYAITVTFFDAKGKNPTKVLCDLKLDDIPENNNQVSCKIPYAAMQEIGELTFVVEGLLICEDKIYATRRAVSCELEVLPSYVTNADNENTLKNPTVEEQIEAKIMQLENAVGIPIQELKEYHDAAEGSAQTAAASAHEAMMMSQDAVLACTMAQKAQKAIENLSVSAESVAPEKDATVEKNVLEDGSVALEFSLPRGKSGVYVGSGDMPDGYNVQIDPSGAPAAVCVGDDGSAEGCIVQIGEVLIARGAGDGSLAQRVSSGVQPIANGKDASAFGNATVASGDYAHAEGWYTEATGKGAHAEGYRSKASNNFAHGEGSYTTASGESSHAEGENTQASGKRSHTEGYKSRAKGEASHGEGYNSEASGAYSHAEGQSTIASKTATHAEGANCKADADYAHAEGANTVASGNASHAEGSSTLACGTGSHAEGGATKAWSKFAHAEGNGTIAGEEGVEADRVAHAEGWYTEAVANGAHAEGNTTKAVGIGSHAEGGFTEARGKYTHAGGRGTIAVKNQQYVIGQYNEVSETALFIVGYGADEEHRSNAFMVDLDADGNLVYDFGGARFTPDMMKKLAAMLA